MEHSATLRLSPELVTSCVEAIRQHADIGDNGLIINPAASNGEFIAPLRGIEGATCKFYDAAGTLDDIVKEDYLCLDIGKLTTDGGYASVHVVGMPPLSRQSSVARNYIDKSCLFCNSISFILPKSFTRANMAKTFGREFHMVHCVEVPMGAITLSGTRYNSPCVFQIWVKRPGQYRELPGRVAPEQFEFVKREAGPHLALRRIGNNAGRAYCADLGTLSPSSHYFVKLKRDEDIAGIPALVDKLNRLTYAQPGARQKSLSKSELAGALNSALSA